MTRHDRFAAHEFINRYWFNYDEGHLDVIAGLLTDDCHLSSRTETGQHPQEEFIRSDNHDRDTKMPVRKRTRLQDRAQRITAERARNQLELALELAENNNDPPF